MIGVARMVWMGNEGEVVRVGCDVWENWDGGVARMGWVENEDWLVGMGEL